MHLKIFILFWGKCDTYEYLYISTNFKLSHPVVDGHPAEISNCPTPVLLGRENQASKSVRPPRVEVIVTSPPPPPPLYLWPAPIFFFKKNLLIHLSVDCDIVQFVYKLDPVFVTTDCLLRCVFV